MVWNIKQFAEEVGTSVDTLRYYEKEEILSPKRRENGYRCYDEEDLALMKNITVMKYACFTLAEMKSMEEVFRLKPGVKCNEVSKQLISGKIKELKLTISNYQKIVTLMEEILPMVDTAKEYDCNKEKIDEFISRIYEDIRGGN